MRSPQQFWIMSSDQHTWFKMIKIWRNSRENRGNLAISIMPADGLAPFSAWSSAGTVMTKFWSCIYIRPARNRLTHWGRLTHMCISKLTIIGSDNGLSPGWRQAIIWTNAGILLIGISGTNFGEILSEIHIFSFTKMHLEVLSTK